MIDRIVVWALSLKAKLSEERGQDLAEYALLSGMVALVILGVGYLAFQGYVDGWFKAMGEWFSDLSPA